MGVARVRSDLTAAHAAHKHVCLLVREKSSTVFLVFKRGCLRAYVCVVVARPTCVSHGKHLSVPTLKRSQRSREWNHDTFYKKTTAKKNKTQGARQWPIEAASHYRRKCFSLRDVMTTIGASLFVREYVCACVLTTIRLSSTLVSIECGQGSRLCCKLPKLSSDFRQRGSLRRRAAATFAAAKAAHRFW